MKFNSLVISINIKEYPLNITLMLPRNKVITIDNISIFYGWNEEGVYLEEWINEEVERREVFSKFYDFNRILSFLYRFNIGLLDDDRVSYSNNKTGKRQKYVGENMNVSRLSNFWTKYKSLQIQQKKRLDCCINLINKSAYFQNELQLQEESFIYLYKIIEIISNEVVNKNFILNQLKGIDQDNNLDMLVKKYLCSDNGINNYPDIASTLKNKIQERYSSAKIKIHHLNRVIKTISNIEDMDSIKEIVDLRNTLSHANPRIDDANKFDEIYAKVFRYVPELICKYYLNENYEDIDCKLKAK